jgi:hypothetical protein
VLAVRQALEAGVGEEACGALRPLVALEDGDELEDGVGADQAGV